MYVASIGVALTSRRPAGCPASEREAQEPWTLLRLRKRGLGPSLGVSWRGFPQLTCLSARQRAPSGPFRSGGRKASIQAGRRGGSTVSCRTPATSWPAQTARVGNKRELQNEKRRRVMDKRARGN